MDWSLWRWLFSVEVWRVACNLSIFLRRLEGAWYYCLGTQVTYLGGELGRRTLFLPLHRTQHPSRALGIEEAAAIDAGDPTKSISSKSIHEPHVVTAVGGWIYDIISDAPLGAPRNIWGKYCMEWGSVSLQRIVKEATNYALGRWELNTHYTVNRGYLWVPVF